MVYKRYIKRGGKLHGPYYYESYRDKNGKVATRYLKEHKSNTKIKNIFFYVFIFIFLLIFLLYIGNARFDYLNKVSGRVVSESGITEIREIDYDSELVSSSDKEVSSSFKDGSIQSDVDLKEKVRVEIINPEDVGIAAENPIIKFDTPDGVINLYFDLLDYNEFAKKNYDNSIITAEDFDIEIKKNPEKYKWGYDVLLKDLNFMSRIDVLSDSNITIIDDSTLKIGNNYISFSDLVKSGYSVSMNEPVILGEMIEEVEEVDDETSEERADSRIDSRSEEVSDRFVSGRRRTTDRRIVGEGPSSRGGGSPGGSPEYGLTGSVIRRVSPIGSFINFFVYGFSGLTGLIIIEPDVNNIVSVYVQRDFNNTNYSLGDLITLDPELVIFGGNATNGTTVYRCGEINESGTYTMNQSINQSENADCIKIIASDVILDCGGFNVTSNLAVSGVFSNQTNTTVKNCYVDMGSGSGGYGVKFVSSNNLLIQNVTTNANYYGIYLLSSSNNTLTNITSNSNVYGIVLSISSNNTLTNITSNSNSYYGIFLSFSSNNNILTNITSNSNGQYGIALNSNSNRNTFYDINLWNCSSAGTFSCIYILETDYNIFDGGFINKSSKYGVYLSSSGSSLTNNADHNIFSNINITNIANTNVFLNDDGTNSENTNNTFINVSYNNETVDSRSELIRQWYHQVYVNDSSGNPANNVSVVFYDNYSLNLRVNLTTNSSGWTDVANLTDYVKISGSTGYYSNYSIFAYNNTHVGNVSFNVTLEKNKLNNSITILEGNFSAPIQLAYTNTTVYKCGNINSQGTYTMNQSINQTLFGEDCIIISSSNVILDCQGYNITSDYSVSGIYSDQQNSTIKNCNINVGDNSGGYGIEFLNVNNSIIENVTINTSYYGTFLSSSSNNTLTDITSSSNSQMGIYLTSGSNNNTLTNITSSSNSQMGIYLTSGSNNNTLTNITSNSNYYGILLSSSSNNTLTNITSNSNSYHGISLFSSSNNTLTNITSNSNHYGTYLSLSSNNTLTNITSNSNRFGIYLTSGSNNNTLINITSNSNGFSGILLSSSSNNILTNITSNSNSYYGIYLLSSSNNTLTNITSNSNRFGIYLTSGSNNNTLTNITSNLNVYGIAFASSSNNILTNIISTLNTIYGINLDVGAKNNILLNATYPNESVDSTSQLIRKWYYQAHVTDNSSTNVANASVLAYNVSGDLTMNLTTNATGWTPVGNIIDYINSGGTRVYQSNYILATNANQSLWDSHNYNVTSSQNNLNDSFIVNIDVTPPTLSGSVWSATSSDVVVNWTTNEGSNSSVTYWASPETTVGNNKFVISHTVGLTGLSSNTTYNYYYTSCDFAGNCVSSDNFTFRTAEPNQATSGTNGGGYYCLSNIKCDICSGAPVGKEGTRTCEDDNNCPGSQTYTESCIVPNPLSSSVSSDGSFLIEFPLGFEGGANCIADLKCGEWSGCRAVYNFDELAEGNILLPGEIKRTCVDNNQCLFNKIERQSCDSKVTVKVKKVYRCFKEYIEIYNLEDVLISRLELVNGEYRELNVQMLFDEFGYCPYCYDGKKNFDEDELDCVYSGDSCRICQDTIANSRPGFNINIVIIILTVLLSFLIIFYIILTMRREMFLLDLNLHKEKLLLKKLDFRDYIVRSRKRK